MSLEEDNLSLTEAIQRLSSKKKQVVSEDAIKAKEELDSIRHGEQPFDNKRTKKQFYIIEEFTHSVRLLSSIFKRTQFDQLALFITHPSRVLVLNFFIGILRGMGFMIGVLLVLGICIYFLFPQIDVTPLLHLIPPIK